MSTKRRTLGVWSSPSPKGQNGERLCRNCLGPMPKDKRLHNCSPKCVEEWRCKTSPSHLRWVLFRRDHGVCAKCALDTKALQKEYEVFCYGAERKWVSNWYGDAKRNHSERRDWLTERGIPMGRESTDWWDADHIIPVIEGGGECGTDNLQTLCIPCHRKETAELRKRMTARSKARKPQIQMSLL